MKTMIYVVFHGKVEYQKLTPDDVINGFGDDDDDLWCLDMSW